MAPDAPIAQTMRRTRDRLARWSKPALVLFAPDDPILGPAHALFRNLIPTAENQPEILLPDTGHFVPEERGNEVAQHILDFLHRTQGTDRTGAPPVPPLPDAS
jgi:haloalkane dehalogenase